MTTTVKRCDHKIVDGNRCVKCGWEPKVFERHRTLEELQAVCAERGWTLNTAVFEQGGDGVSFHFKIGEVSGFAVFNTFNGQIIGHLKNGEPFSSQDGKHEGEPWFNELLDVAYVS
jgi:hypothetical protein